jgi:hypothetical protein
MDGREGMGWIFFGLARAKGRENSKAKSEWRRMNLSLPFFYLD